jgi:hypothetical protein
LVAAEQLRHSNFVENSAPPGAEEIAIASARASIQIKSKFIDCCLYRFGVVSVEVDNKLPQVCGHVDQLPCLDGGEKFSPGV